MKLYFHAPGKPVPQPRPRVFSNGGVKKDSDRSAWAKTVVRSIAARHVRETDGWSKEGLFKVSMRFDFKRNETWVSIEPLGPETIKRQLGDCDNLAKLVLDALKGVTWKDDKQVRECHIEVIA